MTVDEGVEYILQTNHATRRWSVFHREMDQVLHTSQPNQLSAVFPLMRTAPDELVHLVQHKPPNMMHNIIRFFILLTSQHPIMSDFEMKQVGKLSKSLLMCAAKISRSTMSLNPLFPHT